MKKILALLALALLALPASACPPGFAAYGTSSFQVVVPTVSTVVVPGYQLAPAGYVQAPLVAPAVGFAGYAAPAFVSGYGFGFHRQRVFVSHRSRVLIVR